MSEFKELPVSESPEMQFVMSADLSTPAPQNEAFSSIIHRSASSHLLLLLKDIWDSSSNRMDFGNMATRGRICSLRTASQCVAAYHLVFSVFGVILGMINIRLGSGAVTVIVVAVGSIAWGAFLLYGIHTIFFTVVIRTFWAELRATSYSDASGDYQEIQLSYGD
ncbi:hypothetical protein BV898_10023 [Hypsibius exemplaris]|uniref:Uncharacterized protein n=1 Tax=Hypsibius exemplaris TaxID=2072580 RepID=A0A1W0WKR8_HYPEX|nr:hypothetical protein BV898_10023 [Hypsibius exemplaris]